MLSRRSCRTNSRGGFKSSTRDRARAQAKELARKVRPHQSVSRLATKPVKVIFFMRKSYLNEILSRPAVIMRRTQLRSSKTSRGGWGLMVMPEPADHAVSQKWELLCSEPERSEDIKEMIAIGGDASKLSTLWLKYCQATCQKQWLCLHGASR